MIGTDRADRLYRIQITLQKLIARHPDLIHALRFAVASVYALRNYYEVAKGAPQPRGNESQYIPKTQTLVAALLANKPPDADWERGFWFNSAIMRIDALWERIFKLLHSGGKCDGPTCYNRVRQDFEGLLPIPYEKSSFGRIREVVNQLKHDWCGASQETREDPELPLQVLEDLLNIIGEETVRKKLETFKSTRMSG